MEENNIRDNSTDTVKTNSSESTEGFTLPRWYNYSAVSKFKSVRRSIRRGHIDQSCGIIYPNRLFNNRKTTIGRSHNQLKKRIYEQIRGI